MKPSIGLSLAVAAGGYLAQAGPHNNGFFERRAATTADSPALTSPDKPTLTGTVANCNKWYDVVKGDYCYKITHEFGITLDQFKTWNPAVGSSCVVQIGVSYCVGVGPVISTSTTSPPSTTAEPSSTPITSPPTTTIPYSTISYNKTTNPITITESDWPPTQTQPGQPSYCINWYQANQQDDCKSIVLKYSTWMSLNDFLEWNPAVEDDCSNIYFGYWYCVGIQPQTSNHATTTATSLAFPTWTYTPPPPMNTSFSPSPAQSGIADACQDYFITDADDTCASIVSSLGFLTVGQFIDWNPAVGSDCLGIKAGYYYCVWNGTSLPMPSTTTVLPSPVQTGISTSCTAWYQATEGDDCNMIVAEFGTFSKSQFVKWNPAVQSDCSGLVIGDFYCVAIPGTPTTRTMTVSPAPTPSKAPGTISTCSDYWLVGVRDDCARIAMINDITVADLKAWNPSLNSDCSGLAVDTYICVGVPSSDTSTSSSTEIITSAPSSSPTTISPAATPTGGTPSPIQTGMVSGCIRFYNVGSGDNCYKIALDAGVALEDFYAWNPAVQSDCSRLLVGQFVCIGKSGYATTITSVAPVPVTPTPTQSGMVNGCRRFYDVHTGDSCYDLASDAGIPLSDLYAWNPAVTPNCAGLQASVFVCIATSGPITTITSGTPVPIPTS